MARWDILVVKRTKYGTAHTAKVKPYSLALLEDSVERCESLGEQLAAVISSSPTPSREKTEHELVRTFVYGLEDVELILWLKQTPHDALNTWEKEFATGVVRFYEEKRRISWKQRKYAREIIETRFRDQVLVRVKG